jgi:hypothetical protein
VNNFHFWNTSAILIKTFFILYHTKLFIFSGRSLIPPRLLSPSPCALSMVIILCDELHLFPPNCHPFVIFRRITPGAVHDTTSQVTVTNKNRQLCFRGKMSERLSEPQLKYAAPWVIMGRQEDVVLERKYTEEKNCCNLV